MAAEYPPVCRLSKAAARCTAMRRQWEESHRLNIACARATELAVQNRSADGKPKEGCIQPLLEQYGFERVNYVLANSLKPMLFAPSITDDIFEWSVMISVPNEVKVNREFTAKIESFQLTELILQSWEARHALGLFEFDQCVIHRSDLDFEGRVLALNADVLPPENRSAKGQLWYAVGGNGCRPVCDECLLQAVSLENGTLSTWTRAVFLGVLDEQFLPDWAAEKLAELCGAQEQQPEQSSGGMEIR